MLLCSNAGQGRRQQRKSNRLDQFQLPLHCAAFRRAVWITEAANGIMRGMSDSPMLANDGSAIGIVCCGGAIVGQTPTESGPHPRLAHNLPAGLLRDLS
jgi:hypothetical protein